MALARNSQAFVIRQFTAALEHDDAPLPEAVFGQHVLHPLIGKVRVHADAPDAPLQAQALNEPEGDIRQALAPVCGIKGHPVDHSIRLCRLPRTINVIIGRLAAEINAHICCDLTVYFQDIASLVLYILLKDRAVGVIIGPLDEALLSLEGPARVDDPCADVQFLCLCQFQRVSHKYRSLCEIFDTVDVPSGCWGRRCLDPAKVLVYHIKDERSRISDFSYNVL